MNEQAPKNYQRIAEVIAYAEANFKNQPNIAALAEKIQLSPLQFLQLFTDWAKISPKHFLQYTSIKYVKNILHKNQPTLFETAALVAPSDIYKLHSSYIKIEKMTASELENGAKNLSINYSFANSPFGLILIASTPKGICYSAFIDNKIQALSRLKHHFPYANFTAHFDALQQNALLFFNHHSHQLHAIKLHVKGSTFQFKVWQNLLQIPFGQLTTYGKIAQQIGKPNASRAVGTAIGGNPIAFLIPCHRVIQASGKLGGYMWGTTRKTIIIAWEASQINGDLGSNL